MVKSMGKKTKAIKMGLANGFTVAVTAFYGDNAPKFTVKAINDLGYVIIDCDGVDVMVADNEIKIITLA